jgi:hypothetical protein
MLQILGPLSLEYLYTHCKVAYYINPLCLLPIEISVTVTSLFLNADNFPLSLLNWKTIDLADEL